MKKLSAHQENLQNVEVCQTFQGGSGADISCLKKDDNTFFVRKLSNEYPHKLKDQFQWFRKNQDFSFLPRVYDCFENPDCAGYDMEFLQGFTNAFDSLVASKEEDSHQLLEQIYKHFDLLHQKNNDEQIFQQDYQLYINLKVEEKVQLCLVHFPSYQSYFDNDIVDIYGKSYIGLKRIIAKLRGSKAASLFVGLSKNLVHGDPTLENILVNEHQLMLIDPNVETILPTWHLDWGKLYQSLNSEYELYLNKEIKDKEIVHKKLKVCLAKVEEYLLKNHNRLDLIRIKFHEAIHLVRLLPYRINDKQQWEHFFFMAIIRLNEFLEELESA